MKNNKRQSAKVNYVWVLAGGYLIYLAFQLIVGVINGSSEQPVVGIIGGAVFALVGALALLREWKAYKYGQEHIDDPETWTDDPELLEELKKEAEKDADEEGAEEV